MHKSLEDGGSRGYPSGVRPLCLVVLLAASAGAASPKPEPLDWDKDSQNAGLAEAKQAVAGSKKPLDVVLGVTVAVSPYSKIKASDFAFALYAANHIYNGLDPYADAGKKGQPAKKGSSPCGVGFEYRGGVKLADTDLPRTLRSKGHSDAGDNDRDYYGGDKRLSELELALLGSVEPPPAGVFRVFIIPSLGGGHGTSYPDYSLKPVLEKMEGEGLIKQGEAATLLKSFRTSLILSDTAGPDTLAHELGHILLNRGHVDPDSDKKYEGNLMITGGASGGADGILLEDQCSRIRYRAKDL